MIAEGLQLNSYQISTSLRRHCAVRYLVTKARWNWSSDRAFVLSRFVFRCGADLPNCGATEKIGIASTIACVIHKNRGQTQNHGHTYCSTHKSWIHTRTMDTPNRRQPQIMDTQKSRTGTKTHRHIRIIYAQIMHMNMNRGQTHKPWTHKRPCTSKYKS